MYITVLITGITVTLLLRDIRFKFLTHINLLSDNLGYFAVRVAWFPVFSGRLRAGEHGLLIVNRKDEEKKITLRRTKKAGEALSLIDNGFMRVLKVRGIKLFFSVGKSDDAFVSALVSGSVNTVAAAAAAVFKTRFGHSQIQTDVKTEFDSDVLSLYADGIICLRLADIIYSLIDILIQFVKKKVIKRTDTRNKT